MGAGLSKEQREVVRLAESGESFFFTGVAGTGKTFVLKHMCDLGTATDALGEKTESTHFTALTGTAAAQLERATTLHAWAGLLGSGDQEKTLRQVRRNANARLRWVTCKRLIIDEVSMMSADLFECLDFVAKNIRKNTKPFGGIQLIMSGDFLQLPPVGEADKEPLRLCYMSPLWQKVVKKTVELKTVYRQKDVGFVDFLFRLRTNALTKEDYLLLHTLVRPLTLPQGLEPLKLTPHRKTAERDNLKRLSELPGEEHVFLAQDAGPEQDKLCPMTTLPKRLVLKEGAQVMLLKNFAKFDLVNGSIGIVKTFVRPSERKDLPVLETVKSPIPDAPLPVVRFGEAKEVLVGCDKFALEESVNSTRTQLPLSLAWTCTIHKSQGMTAEYLEVDLTDVFEFGQAYVALSRARGFDGLRVLGFNALKMKSNPEIINYFTKQREAENQPPANSTSPQPKKPKKTTTVKSDPKQPSITQFFAINKST